jgi:hypothetical protein
VRVYWPWWMFPVAFAIWFVKAAMRLAAWPFQVLARRQQRPRPRQVVHVRVRIRGDAEKPVPPQ